MSLRREMPAKRRWIAAVARQLWFSRLQRSLGLPFRIVMTLAYRSTLRRRQVMPARALLPDEVVHAIGNCLGLLVREGRPWQRLPEVVENEHLHLGLGGRVLRPVVHGPEQVS